MTKKKIIINQSLEDIEDGIIPSRCFNCGGKQLKLVLVLNEKRTQNFIGTCRNKNCFRYNDLEMMPSWMPV